MNVLLNSRILNLVRSFLNDDRGQGLVEYAIVIATVSLVAIAALNLVGRKANNTLRNVANSLS
ncbi:MAG: Flp family type IVb pilin [Vulcanimicrobiaceae bacterium]